MRSKLVRWADLIGGLALVLFVCQQLGADEPTPVTPPVAAQAAEPAEPAKKADPAEVATPAEPAEPAKRVEIQVEEREDVEIKRGWPLPQSGRYRLGLSLTPVPKALDEQLKLKGEGLLVTEVAKDSPAAKGGILVHDILLKANNGQSLSKTAELPSIVDATRGEDLTLQVLRAGEKLTVTITPQKIELNVKSSGTINVNTKVPFSEEIEVELHNFEEKIREKLHDAGIDVRMQLVKPGQFLPKDVVFSVQAPALPDDLTVTFVKEGNTPAVIEVKRGDQVWRIKETELGELPKEVRVPVEIVLGRGPVRMNLHTFSDRIAREPELLIPKHPGETKESDAATKEGRERRKEKASRVPDSFRGQSAAPTVRMQTAPTTVEQYYRSLGFGPYPASAMAVQKQIEAMSQNMSKMQDEMRELRKLLQERSVMIKD